jgi:transcriptional regulator with XRE-family HTH domain
MRVVSSSVPAAEVPYSALIGQVIKKLREGAHIDQGAMAAQLGLSQSAYSRLECGETNMNVWQLRACAAALGQQPAQLLALAQRREMQLQAQGIAIVPEKRTNPAGALIGLAILAALLASSK